MVTMAVFYSFARSGGTLINRCLASIPNNLVLSEVNPHGAVVPLEIQANQWFGLIPDSQVSEFSSLTYIQKIRQLSEVAEQRGQQPIIRDWPTLNFLPGVYATGFSPSMVLEQAIYLSYGQIENNSIAVVRRSASVYESITRCFVHLRSLTVDKFGLGYLEYARAIASLPCFKLEAFCKDPKKQLGLICSALKVHFCEDAVCDFSKFDRCTGDNKLDSSSRSAALKAILPLKENTNSEAYLAAMSDTNCQEADRLLGYEN
jgi:hypothetical protein